jgi:hypothetical protein
MLSKTLAALGATWLLIQGVLAQDVPFTINGAFEG